MTRTTSELSLPLHTSAPQQQKDFWTSTYYLTLNRTTYTDLHWERVSNLQPSGSQVESLSIHHLNLHGRIGRKSAVCHGAKILHLEYFNKEIERRIQGTPIQNWPGVKSGEREHVIKFNLTKNMRVQLLNDTLSGQYAATLLEIGKGRFKTDSNGKDITECLWVDMLVDSEKITPSPVTFLNSLGLQNVFSQADIESRCARYASRLMRNLDVERLGDST
ncbi:hypothetical protein AVEN_234829-1 [Araneus ventricosus]|uniref:Uncharacterized protein n=1 Tax=Araneus ventricosus TaxID=182803 RepID=A0A4Y2F7U6_ARAVE|nr:hypothetical protein AVEN_234829-1 [Araneus ventricosus]